MTNSGSISSSLGHQNSSTLTSVMPQHPDFVDLAKGSPNAQTGCLKEAQHLAFAPYKGGVPLEEAVDAAGVPLQARQGGDQVFLDKEATARPQSV